VANRANQVSPEIELLLICARRRLDAAAATRLTELAGSALDWPLLLHLAGENGLLPLLRKHLLETAPAAIPPDSLSQLREAARANALRALFLSAELFRVSDALRLRGISAISYKGPVLAARAYGNPSLRQFDDLDIVVSQNSMPAVYEIMAALAYQARLPREAFFAKEARAIPGEYVFVHKINGAMVEVHTESTLRHFPIPPDLERMFRRSSAVSVDGREVPAFATEDEVIMLSVHGSKDFWARLIWVADVAELLAQSAGSLDFEGLFAEAKRLKITRMLKLGFSLAREVLNADLPEEAARAIENDRAVQRLTAELRDSLLHLGGSSESLFRRSLYRIRMTEALGDGLRYWARLSTAPAEDDWAMAHLGERSSRFYAFLRPFRLWRKYGPGAARIR